MSEKLQSVITTILGLAGGVLIALGILSEDTVNSLTDAILAAVGGIATIVAFVMDFLKKDEDQVSTRIAEKTAEKIKTLVR